MSTIYKCKECAGKLELLDNGLGKCLYCDAIQTLPKDKSEEIQNLLNRANDFRINCDFDRAIFEYEKALEINEAEPEIHWGLFLSKYGVEYVKDPLTYTNKPTLHRISSVSVFDDVDYKATMKYAMPLEAMQYKADAEKIEKVMKELLLISTQQEAFDIFLSYKEVDDSTHQRTDDSHLAHDLYNELTAQGYKVFFAPKSLGAGLYEPKIYSAIISSKVMLVLGTKPQYFNAVWVKNEWSRFVELIEHGEEKEIIPIYRNMKANELPNKLAKYEALDMANINFLPKLLEMIASSTPLNKSYVDFKKDASTEKIYLERGFLELEDRNFARASAFFENVLNLNPHNAQAYIGKLMIDMKVSKKEQLLSSDRYLKTYKNFEKAVRFADSQTKADLLRYEQHVQNTLDTLKYNKLMQDVHTISDEKQLSDIIRELREIEHFKDTKLLIDNLSKLCKQLTDNRKQKTILQDNIAKNRLEKEEKSTRAAFLPNEFALFKFLGVGVGIVVGLILLIESFKSYDFLGIIMGPIAMVLGGGLIGLIAFGIGFVLDLTLGNALALLFHNIKHKSTKEMVEQLDADIKKEEAIVQHLDQEYDVLLKKVKQINR